MSVLTPAQVDEAGLTDWRLGGDALLARYRTDDFVTALALLNSIAAVAEEMNHHPDLHLGYGQLDIRLWSHDAGGVTGRDIRLARRVTELAHRAGAESGADGLSTTASSNP